jgi:FKBP-type peptidyl-prolyl cis-trans isomerase
MRLTIPTAVLCACLLATPGFGAEPISVETEDDKILYAIGVAISQNLVPMDLNDQELEIVKAGLADGAKAAELLVSLDEFGPKIQGWAQSRIAAGLQREKAAGAAYVAKVLEEPGAVKSDSGLVYREIEAGSGALPGAGDTVKVHYHGTLRNGTVFDSSLGEGNEPVTFSLNAVVPCFSEGIQKMKVGGKSKLTCPSDLAYGDRGAPPKIRPGAALTFEVQLLEIVTAEAPAPQESPAVQETPAPQE